MRARQFQPLFVDNVPASLKEEVLYICLPYRTMSHLCACGCGRRIVTPLRPARRGWTFSYDGENASVYPSVGLAKLPCKSHYIIDQGRVHWLPAEDEIPTSGAESSPLDRPWWSSLYDRISSIVAGRP